MICERLLKQQEVRLRYEYETVLNQRLEGMPFWAFAFASALLITNLPFKCVFPICKMRYGNVALVYLHVSDH